MDFNKSLERRSFLARIGLFLSLLPVVPALAGCPTFGDIYTAIKNYVVVGLDAFQAILNILQGAGVIPPGTGSAIALAIAAVKAAFADIQTFVTDYQNAPAANKATLLGKISTALAVAQQMLAQFWSDLHIPDTNLASIIEGLLGVIVSTLAGFATQLPAPSRTAAEDLRRAMASIGHAVAPKRRSVKEFKRDFNALLTGQYSQHQIR